MIDNQIDASFSGKGKHFKLQNFASISIKN